MDNQQKTEVAYANYLAGILDGEGYVALIPLRNKNKRTCLMPRISLNNTDARILANIQAALTHFRIPYHIYESGTSKCFDIRIRRLNGIRRFLQAILGVPFLGKRQECILLKEFADGRFDSNGIPLAQKNHPHTNRDFEIANEIKAIRTSQRAYVQQLNADDVLRSIVKAIE